MKPGKWFGFGVALLLCTPPATSAVPSVRPLPHHLSETGLYRDGSTTEIRPGLIAFSPQYPLWSDGATKRRWIALPPGTFIDGSNPDAWEFPRGTRLWKEFSVGRAVETRFIERLADGSWRFANKAVPITALLVLYRAAFFYGTSRWIAWTMWAHVVHHYPYDLSWGGPHWVHAAHS